MFEEKEISEYFLTGPVDIMGLAENYSLGKFYILSIRLRNTDYYGAVQIKY